eukprot:TRINITY_DN2893_c0_g2_i1.p1 TRINITY_DN2893_c0_g2~~TRINITY_DN2893_c0_g2_i1.p1  ORF type:complete len:208 (-),score=54.51 TRINITY_DN2893_c0_g2_i1:126-749(-)
MKVLCGILGASVAAIVVQGVTQPGDAAEHSGSAANIAQNIIERSKGCFRQHAADESAYASCTSEFCEDQCGSGNVDCRRLCSRHAQPLFAFFKQSEPKVAHRAEERAAMIQEAANEQRAAMDELLEAQDHMRRLNRKMAARASDDLKHGDTAAGRAKMAKVRQLNDLAAQIDQHLGKIATFQNMMSKQDDSASLPVAAAPGFLQMTR